jgi:hypothetical protein
MPHSGVALDPASIALLGVGGHVPVPDRFVHERDKLLGSVVLPKRF